jgi:hypothetical protein
MKRITAAAIGVAVTAGSAGVMAQNTPPPPSTDVPAYSGPMFANPDKLTPAEPFWRVTLDGVRFDPVNSCQRSQYNYPTAERFAGKLPPVIARFRYGADEVVIYSDESDPSEPRAIVYTGSEATCRGIANGAIPLVKPPGGK